MNFLLRATASKLRLSAVSICLVSASLTAASSVAYADQTESQSESKAEILPDLMVSATRSTSLPGSLAASKILIDREQIELSGASNVAEILSSIARVQLRDLFGNGTSVTIGMRGFGDNASLNSLIMIDGRKLNNSLDIGAARLSGLNVDQIEAIEIISGSAGVLFGESAVGGVINIITRGPSDHTTLQVSRGSYDNEQYSVSTTNQTGAWDFSADVNKQLGNNYRDHSANNSISFGVEFGYALDNGRIWLELNNSNEHQQLPGALFASEYAADRKASRNTTDFLDGLYRSSRAGINIALDDQWQLEVDVTQRDDDINGSQVVGGNPSPTLQNRNQSSFNPRLIGRFSQSAGDFIVTAGFDYDEADYFLSSIFGTQEAQQTIQNLYLQLLIPVTTTVNLQTGVRHSRLQSDIKDSFTFPLGTSDDKNLTQFSFGLEWTASDNVNLFLRRDENFRFAKIEEHTNQFNFTSTYQPLNHQQGVSIEAGVQVDFDQTRVNFSLYELTVNDEIIYDSTTFSNINLDTTKRVGADLGVTSQLSRALSVNLQLSVIDAQFDSGPYSNKDIPFVAQQNISAGLTYQTAEYSSIHFEWLQTGKRYAASDFSNGFAKIDAQDQLNVAWRMEKNKFVIDARVNNLLAAELISFATVAYNPATFGNDVGFYAAPVRTLMVSVSYQPGL